jgi:hypothetical protein
MWFRWLALWLVLLVGSGARAGPSVGVAEAPAVAQHAPEVPAGWALAEGPGASVWSDPSDSDVALRLARHAASSLPRLAEVLDLPMGRPVTVLLADTPERFRALQPGAAPVWADATAYPGLDLIVLRAPRQRAGDAQPLEVVLDHELLHLLVGLAFPDRPAPRWLQEGLAQVYSGEVGPDLVARLRMATGATGPLALSELPGAFHAGAQRANLAYAQSADLIAFVRVTWGDEAIRRLLRETAKGQDLAAAMTAATGQSVAEVEAAWLDRYGSRWWAWADPAALEGALWGLGGLALLGVGAVRVTGRRRRLRLWRSQESLLRGLSRAVLQRRAARRGGFIDGRVEP